MTIRQTGIVYLVGSGPGDLAYLTVRGQTLLAQAEVLVYDALVDSQLLELVPGDCLRLNVGKRGGRPSMRQEEINDLLVQHCEQGRLVVRLKSGDPFIFGRSHSEIAALNAANCAYEVIPGISSALAAPLLAGIPLTDPVMSRCFAVLSAHDPGALDWDALARLETLVILMGGKNLDEIVQRLRSHACSPATPIAIIRWAGHPQQQIWDGTLADIVRKTANQPLSPCVIVIGEVVRLRAYLTPVSPSPHLPLPPSPMSPDPPSHPPTPPLTGKTILVTRSAGQSSQFSDRLQQEGATVIEMPALEIGPPSSWAELDRAIADLAEFDWLILTSANSVDYFFERLAVQIPDPGPDPGSDPVPNLHGLSGLKIAVVGDKTAHWLEKRGITPDFVPPEFVADSLAAHFPDSLEGCKILFPRVESGGRDVLVKDFVSRGAMVTEVAAYQSRCPAEIAPAALDALQNRAIDVVTFASSKTVKHFCQLLEQTQGDGWHSWLEGVCIASIGPQTSKTCTDLVGRVDVEAQEYSLEGLIQAIISFPDMGC